MNANETDRVDADASIFGSHYDRKIRIVSLDNLTAMCARISTRADRYDISSVTRSRVRVTFQQSGWGLIDAIYPCYPSPHDKNPNVVLDALRYVPSDPNDPRDNSAFFALVDGPELRPGFNPAHVTPCPTCDHSIENDSPTCPCRCHPYAAAPVEWRTAEEWDRIRAEGE